MIKETIIAYALLCDINFNIDSTISSLNEQAQEYIKKGWQPFSSPAINNNGLMCQAVVKYKE